MKAKCNRIVAALLTVAMVTGMAPETALAAEENQFAEETEVLTEETAEEETEEVLTEETAEEETEEVLTEEATEEETVEEAEENEEQEQSEETGGTEETDAETLETENVKETSLSAYVQPDFYGYQDEDGVLYKATDKQTLSEVAGVSFEDSAVRVYAADALAAPTGVKWGIEPGHMVWNAVPGSEGDYELEIYKDDVYFYSTSWSGLEEAGEVDICECEEFSESGTYKFRVKAGDYDVEGTWSDWSDDWVYVKPSASLSTPTGLKWSGTTGKWSSVTNAGGYHVKLYRNNENVVGILWHSATAYTDLKRDMTEKGKYTFNVQALSGDITKITHSSWSAKSSVYGTSAVEDQAGSTLDDALGQVEDDPDGALQTLTDGIETDDLAVAMQTDGNLLSKVEDLEQAYAEAKGISVTTKTDDHVNSYVDASKIKVVGAALNADSGVTSMTMNFGKVSQTIDTDRYPYAMNNYVQFNIGLDGKADGDTLQVPVRITIPIPNNVSAKHFRIVHYHQDGTYEIIDPVINGDGTASFTVTSFSSFVFGNELTAATSLQLNKTDMALQKAGDTGKLLVTMAPADANSNLVWSSDNESVATVSNGVVTAVGKGDTVIHAASADNSSVAVSCKVAVAGAQTDESEDITYLSTLGLWMKNIGDQEYTGKNICPEVAVYDNGTLLAEKKDYTVSYKNNKKVGTASVIITGKGNYSGKGNGSKTAELKFSIVPKDLSEVTVSCQENYASSTKTQAPLPKVTDGSVTLKNKTDYTLIYASKSGAQLKNNVIPKGATGEYHIYIQGKGNYTGTIDQKINITDAGNMLEKASVKLASGANKKAYNNGTAVTLDAKDITVTLNRKTLTYGTDYSLEYENNIEIGKATAYVVPASGSSYVGKKEVSFTITGAPLSQTKIEGFESNMTYTGAAVVQTKMTLTDKKTSKKLVENQDYTVTTANNVKVGRASVTIQGKGNYTGTIKKTFNIKACAMSDQNITMKVSGTDSAITKKTVDGTSVWFISDVQTYSKGGCKPVIEVKYGGEAVNGKLTYKNADQISKDKDLSLSKMPCLTFTGTGNFSGKITVYYDIAQSDIRKQTIQVNDVVYTTQKGKFKSVPVLTDAVSGKKLAAGTDYEKVMTYTYVKDNEQQDNEETVDDKAVPETHTKIRVTATGKGKYQGEISAVYEIVAKSVAGAKVTVKDQTYTGQECLPTKADIVVTVGKTRLTDDDYDIETDGSDITNVGKRTFKIVGKGNNYGGVKSVSFKIKQKSFLWWFF